MKPFTSTGIIEPGQYTQLDGIHLKNSGGMPTPIGRLVVDVFPVNFVTPIHGRHVTVNDPIHPNKSVEVFGEIGFKIVNLTTPTPNTAICYSGGVQVSAKLERTVFVIRDFQKFSIPIRIEYPVTLTASLGGHVHLQGSSVPFFFKPKNKLSIGVGSLSASRRVYPSIY